MNAINVVTKRVELVPARTADVSSLTWRTLDDPFNRQLRIQVNSTVSILIEGDDYDALGQWTDDTMKQTVLEHLKLVEA